MNRFFVIVCLVAIVGFLAWENRDKWSSNSAETKDGGKPAAATASGTPAPKFPLAPSDDKSQPPLKAEEMDANIQKKSDDFFGKSKLEDVLVYENFIRNVVITVDNATGKKIPFEKSPIKPAEGRLLITKSGGKISLSKKNFDRYKKYVGVLQQANLKSIAAYYRRAYPLFQAAYLELGMQGYFNDRVIEMLDQILATPTVHKPARLVPRGLHYEFEDPALESLSAIQKILIRIGPQNADLVKAKCKDLRQMITM